MSSQFKLLLIDSDPVFCMGLRAWLQQFSDLEAIAEAQTGDEALAILAKQFAPDEAASESTTESATEPTTKVGKNEATTEVTTEVGQKASPGESPDSTAKIEPKVDLAIVDLGLPTAKGGARSDEISGLALCEMIKSQYPHLPILLLTSPLPSAVLAEALRVGVDGYCRKGTPTEELVDAIRTCAGGGKYLDNLDSSDNTMDWRSRQSSEITTDIAELPPELRTGSQDEIASPQAIIRQNLRRSSLRQINRALLGVEAHLESLTSSASIWDAIERIVLEGRQRELRTTRWLVTHVLPVNKNTQTNNQINNQTNNIPHQMSSHPNYSQSDPAEQSPIDEQQIVRARLLQAEIFDLTAAKLHSGLYNLTNIPLEIDILNEAKKRELLLIILRQFEDLLVELRLSQVEPQQLFEQREKFLLDLWQAATISFFGKYYSVNEEGNSRQDTDRRRLPVIDVLLGDASIVQTEILAKIPQVSELISYLLFQTDLVIDNASYAVGTLEAKSRSESLLDNLSIGLANAVIQPLLNHFANTEAVKQKFYNYHLIATREIERFRNNLSWKYRLEKYFQAPQAIFESRFDLFVLASPGIKKQEIYAPRNQELSQLGGIQLAVTLALELQDAIAPRLRSAVAFIGSGIVYVLTNVVGRGIGLIGRGILQGIGSAWQDSRSRKTSDRIK